LKIKLVSSPASPTGTDAAEGLESKRRSSDGLVLAPSKGSFRENPEKCLWAPII